MNRRFRLLVIVAGVALTALVAGPWVYINVLREPAAERFVEQTTDSSGSAGSSDANSDSSTDPNAASDSETTRDPNTAVSAINPSGTWTVAPASQVGYRVEEVLFGQRVTAVGRTNAVTGSVTITEMTVTAAEFVADLTTVKSDDSRRDAQFESRIMDTLTHPQATFRLTTPIVLSDTSTAQTTSHSATGDLTLRGTTKQVQITIISSVDDDTISLVGEIVIVFDEWGIPNPSLPGISTEDRGILEFNLILER